jgi:hypothetical protein
MNQTKKRLSIINLAISIGDTETIQLQILKLAPLKRDEKIQEILHGLQEENYAQTQALITDYIETAPDEIHQRTMFETQNANEEEEEAIIEEFDLFRVKPEESHEEVDDILDTKNTKSTESASTVSTSQEVDFDDLLNLKSDEVLPNTLEMSQTLSSADDFFDLPDGEKPYNYTDIIEKDDFFFQESDNDTENTNIDTVPPSPEEEKNKPDISIQKMSASNLRKTNPDIPEIYEPIPYIDQKLKHIRTQYPATEETEETYPTVDAWMTQIKNEGYRESDIEEMMSHIIKLAQEEHKAEAAQLLLVSAATKSKFAQFMLARELYKGNVLQQNLPEAFTLINHLAMEEDYAEAICDLGQFYEHGIGIDKDKKRAEELYREAMELGIKRAKAHYNRLKKENKSLFSFLKK